ncbi:hypothetical protein [Vagococcus xieshaowenii]|uniref:Lipoprotein n=1 Tax=Vagococcus xieshaowenii TaxID=2562451 RepID=A0AAJ5EFM1_9ENTE|nr:hypothetical protein [Vagococcus xieshaowenii]QCA27995.1 hypothetical protein E4Z98_00990 [Vagococcus xieshaowenii]TFZ41238.1 hypothetical protein E4031_05135 [Vagococcus xieshaowenii]
MENRVIKFGLILSMCLLVTGCQTALPKNQLIKEGKMRYIIADQEQNPFVTLIQNPGGLIISPNDEVKQMTVYFDVYHQDKIVKHEEVGKVFADDLFKLKGTLVWGETANNKLNDSDEQSDDSSYMNPLSVAFVTEESSINFGIPDMSRYQYNSSSNFSLSDEMKQLPTNQPVMLAMWSKGESFTTFDNSLEYFKKENLKNEASYFLYVVFSDKVIDD